MIFSISRKIAVLLACLALLAPSPRAATYYVSPVGNDAGSGSAAAPFRTIQEAADAARAGDTVIIRDGIYASAGWAVVRLARSGAPGEEITFKAEHPGGAVLDGSDFATRYGWYFEPGVSYVRVEGLRLRRFAKMGFYIYDDSNISLRADELYDIGRICTDSSDGRAGIFAERASSLRIELASIHDIGRLSPGETGCAPATTYYQNLDHGVYLDGAASSSIIDSTFYNLTHGWGVQVYSGNGTVSSGITIARNAFLGGNPYREGQILLAAPGLEGGLIEGNLFYRPRGAGVRLGVSGGPAEFAGVAVHGNVAVGGAVVGAAHGIHGEGNEEKPLLEK